MTSVAAPLEEQISQWREFLRRRAAIHGADVEELEDHLRNQVAALTEAGLAPDEAFLVAVKRMGNLDALSNEFAREHSERLWKQLVIAPDADAGSAAASRTEAFVVFALAIAAAIAVKLPELFGLGMIDAHVSMYARNASLFVLPMLVAYFAWKRRVAPATRVGLALGLATAALFVNVYPFSVAGDTQWLAALHLPIALWLVVGFAYVGGNWFASDHRMDFVRFTGELVIYYSLIALGGGVLTALTVMMFTSIGVNPGEFIGLWLIPCGAAGAVIVASWLVEAKQSVIENMAPVLTRLFTPMLSAVLLAFLATMAWTGRPFDVERELLIGFDLLLVLVVGLVLYAISARDPSKPPGIFDVLQLVLILSAVAVDAVALAAISGRIGESGFTPNRVAALGENLILLANLAGSAWFYVRFLRGRGEIADLERWQLAYLPAFSFWAAIVVILFPPLFGFR